MRGHFLSLPYVVLVNGFLILISTIVLASGGNRRNSNDLKTTAALPVEPESSSLRHRNQRLTLDMPKSDKLPNIGEMFGQALRGVDQLEKFSDGIVNPDKKFGRELEDHLRASRSNIGTYFDKFHGRVKDPPEKLHAQFNIPFKNYPDGIRTTVSRAPKPQNHSLCGGASQIGDLPRRPGYSPSRGVPWEGCGSNFMWRTGDRGRGRTVCRGATLVGRDVLLLQHMAACEIVHGNLAIANVGSAVGANWSELALPRLREVTGFLLVRNVYGFPSLSTLFPALGVVRGRELLGDFALIITDTALEDVALASLQSVMYGSVYVAGNDRLDSLDGLNPDELHRLDPDAAGRDWIQGPRGRGHLTRRGGRCPARCGAPQLKPHGGQRTPPREGHCWSPRHCQIVCPECPGGCRLLSPRDGGGLLAVPSSGANTTTHTYACCPPSCVGGCYEDSTGRVRCNACRHLLMGGVCVARCSSGLVQYDELFCIREDTCRRDTCGMTATTEEGVVLCVQSCPHGQEPSNGSCVSSTLPADVCERTCPGGVVDSLSAAQSYAGCSYIDGHLVISMSHVRDVTHVLSSALSRVSHVRDYVVVRGTRALRSLHVLPRLRTIGGLVLYQNLYALVLHDNDALEELWGDARPPHLSQGAVLAHNNPRLCASSLRALASASRVRVSPDGGQLDDLNGFSRVCAASIEGLEVTPSTGGDATVSFRWHLSFDHLAIAGFFVHLRPVAAASHCTEVVARSEWTSLYVDRRDNAATHGLRFTLRNVLRPYTHYALYVETYNADGPTMRSDVACVLSLAAAPSPPAALRLTQHPDAPAAVAWGRPAVTNGAVDFYVVSWRRLQRPAPQRGRDECAVFERRESFLEEMLLLPEQEAGNFRVPGKKSQVLEQSLRDGFGNFTDGELVSDARGPPHDARDDAWHPGSPDEGPPEQRSADCPQMPPVHTPPQTYAPPHAFSIAPTESDIEDYLYGRAQGHNVALLALLQQKANATSVEEALDEASMENFHNDSEKIGHPVLSNGSSAQLLQESMQEQTTASQQQEQPQQKERPQQERQQLSFMTRAVRGAVRRAVLEDLEPSTPYVVQVSACNFMYPSCNFSSLNTTEGAPLQDGGSLTSECPYLCSRGTVSTVFSTPPRGPAAEGSVKNLTAEAANGAVVAKWAPPPRPPEGPAPAYVVRLVRDNVTVYRTCTQQPWMRSPKLSLPGVYILTVASLSPPGGAPVSRVVVVREAREEYAVSVALVALGVLFGAATIAAFGACVRCRRSATKISAPASPEKFAPAPGAGEPGVFADWLRDIAPCHIHGRDQLRLEETQLGHGNFGVVRRGELELACGAVVDVAVKQLRDGSAGHPDLLQEAKIMLSLRSNHVVRAYGVVVTEAPPAVLLVLELMLGGSLLDYLHQLHVPLEGVLARLDYQEVLAIGLQVADGMLYLSHQKIVHRDLAARNCLLDRQRYVKISDFGLSRPLKAGECDHYQVSNKNRKVPVRSMPPEFFKSGVYSSQSDVWSFGVLLWEVLSGGAIPYENLKDDEVEPRVRSGLTLHKVVPRSCPSEMKKLLLSCWSFSPLQRPKFEDIVAFLIDEMANSYPRFMERFRRKSFYHSGHCSTNTPRDVAETDSPSRVSPSHIPPAPQIPLPPVPALSSSSIIITSHDLGSAQTSTQVSYSTGPSHLNRPSFLPLIQPVFNKSYGCNSLLPSDPLSPSSTVSTILSPDAYLPTRALPVRNDKSVVVEKVKRNLDALMSIVTTPGKIYRTHTKGKENYSKRAPTCDQNKFNPSDLESYLSKNCELPSYCFGDDQRMATAVSESEYEDMTNPNYLRRAELHITESEEYEVFPVTQPRCPRYETRLHISESNLRDDFDDDGNAMRPKHGTVDGSFMPGQSLRSAWRNIFRKGSTDLSLFVGDALKSKKDADDSSSVVNKSTLVKQCQSLKKANKISSTTFGKPQSDVHRPVSSLSSMKIGAVTSSLDEYSWRMKSFPANYTNLSRVSLSEWLHRSEVTPSNGHHLDSPCPASRYIPDVGISSSQAVIRASSDDLILRGNSNNLNRSGNSDDTMEIRASSDNFIQRGDSDNLNRSFIFDDTVDIRTNSDNFIQRGDSDDLNRRSNFDDTMGIRGSSENFMLRDDSDNLNRSGNSDDTIDITEFSQADETSFLSQSALTEKESGLRLDVGCRIEAPHGMETPPPSRNNSMGSNQTPISHTFFSMQQISAIESTLNQSPSDLIYRA